MTPEIQELKRLAEAAKRRPLNAYREASIEAVNFYRAASPSTILALIEENERQQELLENCHQFFGQMYQHGVALPEAGEQHLERVSASVARHLEALEGVKG